MNQDIWIIEGPTIDAHGEWEVYRGAGYFTDPDDAAAAAEDALVNLIRICMRIGGDMIDLGDSFAISGIDQATEVACMGARVIHLPPRRLPAAGPSAAHRGTGRAGGRRRRSVGARGCSRRACGTRAPDLRGGSGRGDRSARSERRRGGARCGSRGGSPQGAYRPPSPRRRRTRVDHSFVDVGPRTAGIGTPQRGACGAGAGRRPQLGVRGQSLRQEA